MLSTKLQPLIQLIRDYLPKNGHNFFKKQNDEKFKKKDATGFYALRRTAATMAARSGDPFAVQRLLGHVDLMMATRYVQDVSGQTDKVIENSRKYVIHGKS